MNVSGVVTTTMTTMITSGVSIMTVIGLTSIDVKSPPGISNASEYSDHDPRSAVAIIEGITLVVIFVGALFANLMAMTTILTDKVLRRNLHNVLILNLTVMDLGVTITSMGLSIWSIYDNGYLLGNNDALCMINGFGATLFTFGNFTTILAISLDRYLTVCWSTRFPPTKRRAIVIVVFCWALPILNVIPPSFEFLSDFRNHPDTHHCSIVYGACLYFILSLTFIFGITVPVMAFCYFRVMLTIRRQELKMKSHQVALIGNKSSSLTDATTTDSAVSKMSMDTVNIRLVTTFTGDPCIGKPDMDGTGVMMIGHVNIVSRATNNDASDDESNRRSTVNESFPLTSETVGVMDEGDAADVASGQHPGQRAEGPRECTGNVANKAKPFGNNEKERANDDRARLNKLSADKQVAMTGILLVMTTVVCWAPYCIIYSCFLPINSPHWVGVVSMWLAYTNSLLDPLIYAFMNRRVRARYRALIGFRANSARGLI